MKELQWNLVECDGSNMQTPEFTVCTTEQFIGYYNTTETSIETQVEIMFFLWSSSVYCLLLMQSYCDTSRHCSVETLTTPIRPVSLSLRCRWDVTRSVLAARVRAVQCLPAHRRRSSTGMLCCYGEVAREAGSDSLIKAEGGRKFSCGRRRAAVSGRD